MLWKMQSDISAHCYCILDVIFLLAPGLYKCIVLHLVVILLSLIQGDSHFLKFEISKFVFIGKVKLIGVHLV